MEIVFSAVAILLPAHRWISHDRFRISCMLQCIIMDYISMRRPRDRFFAHITSKISSDGVLNPTRCFISKLVPTMEVVPLL